jgi:segregation and condensation protein B
MKDANQQLSGLEALLFIHGEPISYSKIESVLKIDKDTCGELLNELKKQLEAADRGIQLVIGSGKAQLATKPEFNVILENFVREELSEDLTAASLEALSIIAYLGPISRARLEYLRGVNSLVILRSLLIRGLIERIPDLDHANGFVYQPTFDLMKQLGLQGKEDLPEFERFQELLKVFEAQPAAPTQPAPAPRSTKDEK